jgi:tetratricopeptide (TPR) repeat protein
MADDDDTTSLQEQLATHRRTLAHPLTQRAYFDAGLVPSHVAHSIDEARSEIARLKAALRDAGVVVEDQAGDEATVDEEAGSARAPVIASVHAERDVNIATYQTIFNISHHHPQPRLTIDLAQAQQQLDTLPLDQIPSPAPLPPGSRMPLSVNPLFVGREDDLKALATTLKVGTTTVIAAATGMGGVGKTQLASEFVHRYGQFFAGGVFWLSFADPDGIDSEIATCGIALDLPGFAALDFPDQVFRVRQLWQEATPHLLVFDNCEDEELLRRYRPSSGGCRVLVTSRRQRWDDGLDVRERRLGTLPRPESIALLRKFRPDLAEDDRDLDTLAAALGDLPLALHVAGSYLKRYQQVVSPAQYLEKLRSAPLQAFALRGAGATPTAHELDVALTVATSYQRLNASDQIDALALALLARVACFAPGEPILRELVEQTLDLDALPADERALALEDALIRLDELGLSEAAEDGAARLHRLVVAFVLSVGADDAAQTAVEQALTDQGNRLVNDGFPVRLLSILVHLRHAMMVADQRGDAQAGELANVLGRVEQILTNYAAARPLFERAFSVWEQVLGPQHPDTATSLNNLANLLESQGDYMSARPLYERALAIRKQALGPQHPDTARSLNNLASLLESQGDYVSALPLYECALQITEQALGPQHTDTATCLNNLAELLRMQGDYAAARLLYERALAIRKQVLGPSHPDTSTTLNNLAVLFYSQGDYAAAQPLLEHVVQIFEQARGEQHPDTARSLNNLAALIEIQGDYASARPLYERALTIQEQVLGPQHLDTATSLNNLAYLIGSQGDYATARPLYERALSIYELRLGIDHPTTRIIRTNLAALDAPPPSATQ